MTKSTINQMLRDDPMYVHNLCHEAYADNPTLFLTPPQDTRSGPHLLKIFIKAWFQLHNKTGINIDGRPVDDGSSSNDEARPPKRQKLGGSASSQLCEFPAEANGATDLYGAYRGKDERVDIFKWDFTRKLVHFYLSLKTYIPSKVKVVFYASTRKTFRDPTPLETECLTLVYTLHAFFATVPNLEEFMKQPNAIGLQYAMHRLYVLLQIEVEVPIYSSTKTKALDHYKVLLDDYTAMKLSTNDQVQEDVGKLISLKFKTSSDTSKWDDINTNERSAMDSQQSK